MKVGNSRSTFIESKFVDDPLYDHIVVPTVEAVSPDSGLLAGQQITITGSGFSSVAENNQVTVDGLACEVVDST